MRKARVSLALRISKQAVVDNISQQACRFTKSNHINQLDELRRGGVDWLAFVESREIYSSHESRVIKRRFVAAISEYYVIDGDYLDNDEVVRHLPPKAAKLSPTRLRFVFAERR